MTTPPVPTPPVGTAAHPPQPDGRQSPPASESGPPPAETRGPIRLQGTTLDPEFLVWEPDAFHAFRSSADYERVRDALSAPVGQDWDDRPPGDTPRLSGLQCGAPDPKRPDHRCGFTLSPMRTSDADYAYTSARCAPGARGHRTSVRRHIEVAVAAALAASYTPAAMEGAVRAVSERAAVAEARLAALDRRIGAAEDDYRRAGQYEFEARRSEHALNIRHWEAERQKAQQAFDAAVEERRAFQRSLVEYAPVGGLARQLELVREVVGEVGVLLARAERHPEIFRALVRTLTRSLTVRLVAPAVAALEVEFPNGERTLWLALVGRVRCTQPERVFAHHALTSDQDLEAAADRLTRANDRYGPRVLFNPPLVRGLALLHEFFETVPPRVGPLEPVADVATRTGVTADEAVARALDGRLGPAGVTPDGELAVAPTPEELEVAFPTYAARQTERRAGWDSGEAIDVRRLREEHGVSAKAVRRAVPFETCKRTACDLAGRRYIRRSAIPARLLAGASVADDRAAFRAAAGRALDAAGYDATAVDHWWPLKTLLQRLRTHTRMGSAPSLRSARKAGLMHVIEYQGPHPTRGVNRRGLLVYCPPDVADSKDPAVVRAWFNGSTPPPPRAAACDGPAPTRAPRARWFRHAPLADPAEADGVRRGGGRAGAAAGPVARAQSGGAGAGLPETQIAGASSVVPANGDRP